MSPHARFVAADGDSYEQQMGRWSRRLTPLLTAFTGTAGRVRVLDVGCGTGNMSLCLAQDPEVVSVHGLDLSPAYVACAGHRTADPRLTFQVGDACALPFADASFDHSLTMLALQFVARPHVAVREMRRVTRPGGTVAAATWDTRGGFVVLRMIFDAAAMLDENGQQARAAAHIRPMSLPGDLERVWREAGLTDVLQDMLTIRMNFASFVDFWTPMEGREGRSRSTSAASAGWPGRGCARPCSAPI